MMLPDEDLLDAADCSGLADTLWVFRVGLIRGFALVLALVACTWLLFRLG